MISASRSFRSLRPSRGTASLLLFSILLGIVTVPETEGNQKFCGKTLTEAMDLLCVNGYNEKLLAAPEKRQGQANGLYLEHQPPLLLRNPNAYEELNPIFATAYASLLAKTRRQRDGVYDECCRKPCSYSELADYCRDA